MSRRGSLIFVNSSRRRGGGGPAVRGYGINSSSSNNGVREENGNSYFPHVDDGKLADYGTKKYTDDDASNVKTVTAYNGATSPDDNATRGRGRVGFRGPGRGGNRSGQNLQNGDQSKQEGGQQLPTIELITPAKVNQITTTADPATISFSISKIHETLSQKQIDLSNRKNFGPSGGINERPAGARGPGRGGHRRGQNLRNGSQSTREVDPQTAKSELIAPANQTATTTASPAAASILTVEVHDTPSQKEIDLNNKKNLGQYGEIQDRHNERKGGARGPGRGGNRRRGQNLRNGSHKQEGVPQKLITPANQMNPTADPVTVFNTFDEVQETPSQKQIDLNKKDLGQNGGEIQGHRNEGQGGARGPGRGGNRRSQNLRNGSQFKQGGGSQLLESERIASVTHANSTPDPAIISAAIVEVEVQEPPNQNQIDLNKRNLGPSGGIQGHYNERPERPKYSRVFYSSSHKRPFEPRRKKDFYRENETEKKPPAATDEQKEPELKLPADSSEEEKFQDDNTTELPEPEVSLVTPELEVLLVTPEPEVSLVTLDPEEREPLDYNAVDTPEFKVFSNELVFDHIAKYLDHTTLKALSETGKLLLEATRRCPLFFNNTQLNIVNENTPIKKNLVLLKSDFFPWTTVKLDVSKWKNKYYKIIQRVLAMESVESLELEFKQNEQCCITAREKAMDRDSIVRLILSTQNLRSLTIHAEVLGKIEDLITPKLKRHLGSLDTFRIVSTGNYELPKEGYLYMGHISRSDLGIHLAKNLISLSTIEMKLRAFEFQVEDCEPVGTYGEGIALGIIERNQATLEELTLYELLWDSENIAELRCPSLVSLDVRTEAQYASNLAKFIKNQPPLQKLKVHMEGRGTVTSHDLSDAIRMRSSKLRQLHVYWNLKTKEPRVPVDWSFIEQLEHLEDLSIRQPPRRTDQRAPLSEIISKLPPSLKAVKLNGGIYRMGIEDTVLACFRRLRNLTTLDLMHTTNVLTDNSLQYIFSSMTQLFELCIYKCQGVSDFGITGRRVQQQDADAEGCNLSNLKCLRKLKIIMCENVSYPAVRSVATFLELKELRLSQLSDCHVGQSQLSPELVVEIAVQNPSLEIFRVGHTLANGDSLFLVDQLKSRIQETVPRFKTLEIERKYHDSDEDDDFQMGMSFSDIDDDSPFDFSDFDMTDDDDSQEDWSTDSDDELFGDIENVLVEAMEL